MRPGDSTRPYTSWAIAERAGPDLLAQLTLGVLEQVLSWGQGQPPVTSFAASLLCVSRQAFVLSEPQFPHVERLIPVLTDCQHCSGGAV